MSDWFPREPQWANPCFICGEYHRTGMDCIPTFDWNTGFNTDPWDVVRDLVHERLGDPLADRWLYVL